MLPEIEDLYDSPGYYQEGSAMRDKPCARIPKEVKKIPVTAETWVFTEERRVIAFRLGDIFDGYRMIIVPKNHPIHRWDEKEFLGGRRVEANTAYRTHVDGDDFGFFMHAEDASFLEQVSKAKALVLNAQRVLKFK